MDDFSSKMQSNSPYDFERLILINLKYHFLYIPLNLLNYMNGVKK